MTKQPQKPNFHKLYVTLYNDPDWLQLTALHRWLYVVLLTGSQSNSIGCYVCRLSVLSEDTGFDVTVSDMETVSKQMGIRFDNRSRTVYIPTRLKWDPPANPNVLDGMVKTACNLPKCENQETVMVTVTRMVTELVYTTDRGRYFVDNWQEKLAEIINSLGNGLPNLSETPYPYPLPKPQPEPLPNPKPKDIAPRSTERNAVPVDLFLTYPCNGLVKEYHLPMSQVNEWSMLYQGLDVASECKHALAWVCANPTKKKTAKGMPAFLVSWLGRANNKGGRGGATGIKTIQDTRNENEAMFERLRAEGIEI